MAEMNERDIHRDIVGTVIMFANAPHYVSDVHNNGEEVSVRPVAGDRTRRVPFSLAAITAIRGRIGMVNTERGGVYYIYRVPNRRMQIGMSWNNSKAAFVAGQRGDGGLDDIKGFHSTGLADGILGKYPTLRQAIKFARDTEGACAFDRQFAVNQHGQIFYKTQGKVGAVAANGKTIADIKWLEGKEHLSILLENDYEKTVRTLCS